MEEKDPALDKNLESSWFADVDYNPEEDRKYDNAMKDLGKEKSEWRASSVKRAEELKEKLFLSNPASKLENKEYFEKLLGQESKEKKEDIEEKEIMNQYKDAFLEITKGIDLKTFPYNKERLKDIFEKLEKGKKLEKITEDDLRAILWLLHNANKIHHEDSKRLVTISKECFSPKDIKKNKVFNCGGASLLFTSVVRSLGGTCDFSQIYHHHMVIAKIGEKIYWIDPLRSEKMKGIYGDTLKDITNNIEFKVDGKEVSFIKLNKPIVVQDACILYHSLYDAQCTVYGNYKGLLDRYQSAIKGENNLLGGSGEELDSQVIIQHVEQLGGVEKIQKLIDRKGSRLPGYIEETNLRSKSLEKSKERDEEIKKFEQNKDFEGIVKYMQYEDYPVVS